MPTDLPYWLTGAATRFVRVVIFGAIPIAAAWVIDSNTDAAIVGIRVVLSTAILALLDKGVREYRATDRDAGTDSVPDDEPFDDAPPPDDAPPQA